MSYRKSKIEGAQVPSRPLRLGCGCLGAMSRDDAEDGENDSVKSPLHPRQNDPSNMARGDMADVPLLAIEATSDDMTDSVWQNYFAVLLKVIAIDS